MKILLYTALSIFASVFMVVLLPLILIVWLAWRAHGRQVIATTSSPAEDEQTQLERWAERISTLKAG